MTPRWAARIESELLHGDGQTVRLTGDEAGDVLRALRQAGEREATLGTALRRFAVVQKDEHYGFCRLCLENWRPDLGERERHGEACLLRTREGT